MKLIAGLGNPTEEYKDSRHNLGYEVVRRLGQSLGLGWKQSRPYHSLIAQGKVQGEKLILSLPTTFMNLSGRAVRAIQADKDISCRDIIVVCDDINLNFGLIRVRAKGSSGGHNGLRSIIDYLKTEDFARLRIGIRPERAITDLSRYVLAGWTRQQKQQLPPVIQRAADCLIAWITLGINKAMNEFNRHQAKKE